MMSDENTYYARITRTGWGAGLRWGWQITRDGQTISEQPPIYRQSAIATHVVDETVRKLQAARDAS